MPPGQSWPWGAPGPCVGGRVDECEPDKVGEEVDMGAGPPRGG